MENQEILRKLIEQNKLVEAGQAAIYLKGEYPEIVRAAIGQSKNFTPELLEIYENLLLVDAQDDFDCFCRYIDFGAATAVRQFYAPRRKYLKPVVDALKRIEKNETEVLRIALLRRSGKSELAISRFIPWYIGNHPETQNLACVGGGRLANSLFRKLKAIWGEFGTQYLNVFPDMTISKTSNEDRILWINRDSEYGNISVISSDENFEGRVECSGILLIDDIVTAEIAKNKVLLAKQYEDDILGRLMGRRISGNIVIIGTPQHPDDALQRLYSDMESAGMECEKIAIPALDENGESNYEYDRAELIKGNIVYKKQFTTGEFRTRLQMVESSKSPVAMAAWNTTMMMMPMTAEGLVLPELQYWETLPERFEREFCIIDTKTKGSDAFVAFCVKVSNGYAYVTSIFFDTGNMIGMTDRLVDWVETNEVINIDVETNAAGALYSLNIKDELKERGLMCRVDEHYTTRNKHDRIMAAVETIATEFFFKPNATGSYKLAIEQMQTYTADGRALHDDVCLVGETKVATLFGDKRIDSIKKGDYVFTPFGLRKVVDSGKTGYKRTISNRGLRGTGNHKIFSASGFVSLKEFDTNKKQDILSCGGIIRWKYQKMLCLMEKNMHLSDREDIISAHQQKILNEKVQSDFIEQFGSFILARKCRKAIAFTIKMVTLLITTLTTWSVYQLANTLRNTTKKGLRMLNVLKNNLSCLTKSDRKPLRGTPRRKGKSGTLNIQKKWASGFAHIKTIFVKIVEKNLHQETIAPYTVARNVDNNIRQKRTKELNLKTYASCVVNHSHIQSRFMGEIQDHDKRVQNYVKTGSITETEKRENVYNLTIDEIGVFYANGILVSNCDTAALAAEKLKVYQKRARIIITGKI